MPTRRESGALYIGLMSGTSMDSIDAALVEFGDHQCKVLQAKSTQYPDALRSELLRASRDPHHCTVDSIGELDQWVGECFRDAALSLLGASEVSAADVLAIGSHGQTLRHQPNAARPFTLQIGDPNVIAIGTGIATVADFRRADMALGGQGAPLTPAFHQWLFADAATRRVILNIGGIANVTLLPGASTDAMGFDTGPGNTLLDTMARENLGQPYDDGGAWAASGSVAEDLLQILLADEYFALPAPKSTGFEYFNADWLQEKLSSAGETEPAAADIQATLAELSARSIAAAIQTYMPDADDVFVCGGGVHNPDLVRRLEYSIAPARVCSTETCGLHPDWVEAAAFAWLAMRRLERQPGNLPKVTGASRAEVLGSVYLCAS